MRPNFALYGAAAVALVTLATVAEATPAYESDYGHVDEYKSNNYKHEAKYPSSYESDDYKHETSGGNGHYEPHEPPYGSHYEENYGHEEDSGYEEDYGHEEYRPSHYQPKYSMAPSYKHKPYESYSADEDYARSPSYKHQPSYDSYSADEDYGYEEYTEEASYKHQPSYKRQPSYRHRRSVGYGSPYGSQSYKHTPSYSPKQSVGYGSPYEEERPSYRHRRSVDSPPSTPKGEREGQLNVAIQSNSSVEDEGGVREGQSKCCRKVSVNYEKGFGSSRPVKEQRDLYRNYDRRSRLVGGKAHWVSENGKYAIFRNGGRWLVGSIGSLGKDTDFKAYTQDDDNCPEDIGYAWFYKLKSRDFWQAAGRGLAIWCES